MIEWDKVYEEIFTITNRKDMVEYIKSLIAKEFKLVARGVLTGAVEGYYTICDDNNKTYKIKGPDIELLNKKVAIYISEEKGKI